MRTTAYFAEISYFFFIACLWYSEAVQSFKGVTCLSGQTVIHFSAYLFSNNTQNKRYPSFFPKGKGKE